MQFKERERERGTFFFDDRTNDRIGLSKKSRIELSSGEWKRSGADWEKTVEGLPLKEDNVMLRNGRKRRLPRE